ncbi:MAG: hypothetical protein U9R53_07905 [Chloroflexota bacterium]|nr:hypothetical protein [Chloroflexota bacterium]
MLLKTRTPMPIRVLIINKAMVVYFLFLDVAALQKTVDQKTSITVIRITRICLIERMVA